MTLRLLQGKGRSAGSVLLLALLLAACAAPPNAVFVVKACLDQDGNALPPGVTVAVGEAEQTWEGTPLRFPVRIADPVGLLSVRGEADGYRYVSKPQYALRPGGERAVTLRFFRPYEITVEALGRGGAALPGVAVFSEEQRLGTTDSTGRLVWTFDTPGTRPGDRLVFRLERAGEAVPTAPLVLAEARYAYTITGTLDQDGPAPPEEQGRDENDRLARAEPPPARAAALPVPQPLPVRTPDEDLSASSSITELPPEESPSEEPAPDAPTPPPTPLTDRERADAAFADRRYDEALLAYRRIPATDRKAHKHALQQIGRIFLATDRYADAIGAFEQILDEDPSEYAAHNNLAAVYLRTSNFDAALGHLDQVLAKKHLIPRAQRRRAELEVRYTRAAIHYTQFRNERDPLTRREQGLLAMGILRAFIDQVPPGNAEFAAKRNEMEDKLNDLRTWIRENG